MSAKLQLGSFAEASFRNAWNAASHLCLNFISIVDIKWIGEMLQRGPNNTRGRYCLLPVLMVQRENAPRNILRLSTAEIEVQEMGAALSLQFCRRKFGRPHHARATRSLQALVPCAPHNRTRAGGERCRPAYSEDFSRIGSPSGPRTRRPLVRLLSRTLRGRIFCSANVELPASALR
jgi:hypothetical protein